MVSLLKHLSYEKLLRDVKLNPLYWLVGINLNLSNVFLSKFQIQFSSISISVDYLVFWVFQRKKNVKLR